jgi:hypothetical protein
MDKSSAELDEVELLSLFSISSNCILEAAEFTGDGGVLEMSLLFVTLDAATNFYKGRQSSGCYRRPNALPHDGYRDFSRLFSLRSHELVLHITEVVVVSQCQ